MDVALGTAPSQDVSEACGGGAGGGAAGGGGAKALLLSEPRQDRSRQVMAGAAATGGLQGPGGSGE